MASDAPIVIYDANVLFPFHVSHLLTCMAVRRLARAKWTQAIQQEWLSNVTGKRPSELDGCVRRCLAMNNAVPEAMVTGYENLIGGIVFQNPDDRHVIAAAIHSGSVGTVTRDKHFTCKSLYKFKLAAIDPDDLLIGCFERMPQLCVSALYEARKTLGRSNPSLAQYLDILADTGLKKFAQKNRAAR